MADPVGLRRGVHHSIDLGETPIDEGIGMGGGFPLSLVGVWGTSPKDISEKYCSIGEFWWHFHAWYNFGTPGPILTN